MPYFLDKGHGEMAPTHCYTNLNQVKALNLFIPAIFVQ